MHGSLFENQTEEILKNLDEFLQIWNTQEISGGTIWFTNTLKTAVWKFHSC